MSTVEQQPNPTPSPPEPQVVLQGEPLVLHISRQVVANLWKQVLIAIGLAAGGVVWIANTLIDNSVRAELKEAGIEVEQLQTKIADLESRANLRAKLEDFARGPYECNDEQLSQLVTFSKLPELSSSPVLIEAYAAYVSTCQSSYERLDAAKDAQRLDRFDDLLRGPAQSSAYVHNNMAEHYVLRLLRSNVPGADSDKEWERLRVYTQGTRRFHGLPLGIAFDVVAATALGKPTSVYLDEVRGDKTLCESILSEGPLDQEISAEYKNVAEGWRAAVRSYCDALPVTP